MENTKQKDLEIKALEDYLLFKNYKEYDLIYRESPDFELHMNGNIIYIEHTEMMNRRGQQDRARDSQIKRLLQLSKKEFEKKYPQVLVSVVLEFRYDFKVPRKEVNSFIARLTEIVYQLSINNSQMKELFSYDINIDQIESIQVYNMKGHPEQTNWIEENLRLYGSLRKEEFEMAVLRKNQKAEKNLTDKFDQAWLLLHSGRRHASYADLQIEQTWIDETWLFDKIIVYDAFGDKTGVKFKEITINSLNSE